MTDRREQGKAREIAHGFSEGMGYCRYPELMDEHSYFCDKLTPAIEAAVAEAVKAERKRCIATVEGYNPQVRSLAEARKISDDVFAGVEMAKKQIKGLLMIGDRKPTPEEIKHGLSLPPLVSEEARGKEKA